MPEKGRGRVAAGNAAPLRLSLVLPESDSEAFLTAIGLARRAPIFETFGTGTERSFRATFTDMARSLDVVIRLIGEASRCQGAHATIDEREVASLTRFWSALICYQESLAEPNPHEHCLRFSAKLNQFSGCPDQTCLSPCQFLCTRCLGFVNDQKGRSIRAQLTDLARQAEVDWCPNLGLSDRSDASDSRRLS
jgi:hypothetical protein